MLSDLFDIIVSFTIKQKFLELYCIYDCIIVIIKTFMRL